VGCSLLSSYPVHFQGSPACCSVCLRTSDQREAAELAKRWELAKGLGSQGGGMLVTSREGTHVHFIAQLGLPMSFVFFAGFMFLDSRQISRWLLCKSFVTSTWRRSRLMTWPRGPCP
jgi:hypothetical protein